MNSFLIAYRSILERGVASGLTMLSMALGVGLVVAVLSIHGVVAASFRSNSSLGYNMIVGPKGGKEQLTLNTVFYLSSPVENVRYEYYLEFLRKEQRDEQLANSFALTAHELRHETTHLAAHTGGLGLDPLAGLILDPPAAHIDARRGAELGSRRDFALEQGRDGKFGKLCQPALREVKITVPGKNADLEALGLTLQTLEGNTREVIVTRVADKSPATNAKIIDNDRVLKVGDTAVSSLEEVEQALRDLPVGEPVRMTVRGYGFAIPLCLGDYLGRFRVVGTTPQLFNDVVYSEEPLRKYQFAQGRNFMHKSPEHGYFEAVLGSQVARELGLKLGDEISPSHGTPDGHTHQRKFTIVGILASTGTPNDRACFINMEGFYLMEDHAKPVDEEEVAGASARSQQPTETQMMSDDPDPLPLEQREITALLVRTTNPLYASGMQNSINEGQYAQGVFPVQVIYNLFDFIVRPVQQVLLLLTVMICIVSGISILVSIYNSMSERRHEIAVMRALGASRSHISFILLLESILLALGGGLIGWLGGHGFIAFIAPYVEHQTGVQMSWFHWEPTIADLLALFSPEFTASELPQRHPLLLPAELVLLPMLLLLAVFVGLWPSVTAYRTDVAKSLGK